MIRPMTEPIRRGDADARRTREANSAFDSRVIGDPNQFRSYRVDYVDDLIAGHLRASIVSRPRAGDRFGITTAVHGDVVRGDRGGIVAAHARLAGRDRAGVGRGAFQGYVLWADDP